MSDVQNRNEENGGHRKLMRVGSQPPIKRALILRMVQPATSAERDIISEFRFVVAAPDGEQICVETAAEVDTALDELERKKGRITLRVFAERRIPLTA
jgi:hypothetical protein